MEFSIVQWLNHMGSGTRVDTISLFISRRPFLIGIFGLITIFLCRKYPQKRKQFILAIIISSLLFLLINEVACKHLLVESIGIRPRPYVAHPESITPIGTQFSDSSFPSSHMAGTLLMMTLLVRAVSSLRPLAIVFTLLMAFSRMHNGMHYPSDVFAGTILGILYGVLGIRISNKRKNIKFRF